jgi:glucuronokinase
MIAGIAYARAGLLGNPSDGYFGKVLAISVKNFAARVVVEESAELRILPSSEDGDRFASIHEFAMRTRLYGHYGGVRLIKAALKRFHEYSLEAGLPIHDRNFSVRYESSIPRQVGLGGSSAIITAAMRAFMAYYGLSIPLEILPSLVLSAERDELDINAGFMDRVTQVYEGCVYMDLDSKRIAERGYGIYERLDEALLPELYLAYKPALGKISGRVLNEIRMNYDKGDGHTINTLSKIAGLAEAGREALLRRDYETLSRLMDENFDLRRSIMTITRENDELIETARSCGASATFAGSGGSIIGICRGETMVGRIAGELGKIGAIVVRPIVT